MDKVGASSRVEKLEAPSSASLERKLLLSEEPKKSKTRPCISRSSPPTDLVKRLKTFLPALDAANRSLEEKDGGDQSHAFELKEREIEGTDYVELDLACGLFDLKDDATVAAAEDSLINRPKDSKHVSKRHSADHSWVPSMWSNSGPDGAERPKSSATAAHLNPEHDKKEGSKEGSNCEVDNKRHPGIEELN